MIAELIGIPQEDRHKVFEWSNAMVGARGPGVRRRRLDGRRGASCSRTRRAWPTGVSPTPREDVVTMLLTGEVDGEKLTEIEFNLFFMLLAVAGNETTRNLITGGMLALIEHPEERRAPRRRALAPADRGRGDAALREPGELLPAHRDP